MSIGVVGRKAGMTRVFTEDGTSVPVTVVQIEPNYISQVKTEETDGYRAIQITTGTRRPNRVTKAIAGHMAKANVQPGRGMWEFRVTDEDGQDLQVGGSYGAERFSEGQYVDVTGTSIGKGFAGVIKRHNFSMQDATHGNSRSHRASGSIGQNQSPGRVFKGKKMAGHMGNAKCTVQNLEVVRVDAARNLLLIKGAVPGSKNGDVIVCQSVKGKKKASA
jgi:large subunit ribosomal protein L3